MIDISVFLTNTLPPPGDLAGRKDVCVSAEEQKVSPGQNFPGTQLPAIEQASGRVVSLWFGA